MAQLIDGLDAERIRRNLEEVSERIARAAACAGRHPDEVEILAATKYVALQEMAMLAQAGVRLVGENRAQDLVEKHAIHGDLFTWDFIGQLQSRKVRLILPHVRLIHSLSSESALIQLERHRQLVHPRFGVLIQVNVAREPGKAGIMPEELDRYIERSTVPVHGLAAMPPQTEHPEESRRWFAALRELADRHRLQQLSMGTTQDYDIAVQEGATIVRIGTRLYA